MNGIFRFKSSKSVINIFEQDKYLCSVELKTKTVLLSRDQFWSTFDDKLKFCQINRPPVYIFELVWNYVMFRFIQINHMYAIVLT